MTPNRWCYAASGRGGVGLRGGAGALHGRALSKLMDAEQFQAKAWQADTDRDQTVHSAVILAPWCRSAQQKVAETHGHMGTSLKQKPPNAPNVTRRPELFQHLPEQCVSAQRGLWDIGWNP